MLNFADGNRKPQYTSKTYADLTGYDTAAAFTAGSLTLYCEWIDPSGSASVVAA